MTEEFITPFYDHEGVTVYCADCLEVLPTISAGSIDAVITDPPYGTTQASWDSVIPLDAMWNLLSYAIKLESAVVLFGAQPFTSALVMSKPQWFKFEDVWDKKHPKGHLNAKKMPLRRHENIVVFSPATLGNFTYNPQMRKGLYRMKGGGNPLSNKGTYGFHEKPETFNDDYYPTSIIEFHNGNQTDKLHPNEKPVELMEYLIRTYTNPGDVVLDFTAGVMSTGVAAINTGRRFIGIELSSEYCRIGVARLKERQDAIRNSLFYEPPDAPPTARGMTVETTNLFSETEIQPCLTKPT